LFKFWVIITSNKKALLRKANNSSVSQHGLYKKGFETSGGKSAMTLQR